VAKLLKQYFRQEVEQQLSDVDGAVVVQFQGLNAAEEFALRMSLRDSGAVMKVVKASVTRVYLREQGWQGDIDSVLKGPVALVTAKGDGGTIQVAKALVNIVKDPKNKFVKIQGALFDGEVLSEAQVEDLSRMPSREQLLSRLAGAFQSGPQRLASALKQINTKVASVFAALAKKREDGDGAAA